MAAPSRLRVVAALGSTQTLAWASSYYLPAILARPIARDLAVSETLVFAAFSAALLLTAALGPAVGRAIDRRGGRDVLVLSNLLFAAGLGMLALAQGPVGLFAAWLVIGVAMSLGLYDSAFATLAGLYGREARGAITGITLIAGFASTIGWPVTAALEAGFGWREASFAWAGLHLLFGLPVNRLLVPPAPPPPPTAPPAEGAAPRRALVILAFVFAVAGFCASALGAHLPGLLLAAGASPAGAILAASLVGFSQVGARIVEFSVLRRLHPLFTARVALLTHPLGVGALLAFGGPAAAVFTVLHGAGNGMLTIARGTLPLALFGPVGYGMRQGLVTAPARVLVAVAPLAFGLLIERAGPQAMVLTAGAWVRRRGSAAPRGCGRGRWYAPRSGSPPARASIAGRVRPRHVPRPRALRREWRRHTRRRRRRASPSRGERGKNAPDACTNILPKPTLAMMTQRSGRGQHPFAALCAMPTRRRILRLRGRE